MGRDGLYDGIILAYAGVKSLMKEHEVSEVFSTEKIIPSAGQGIISLQCRQDIYGKDGAGKIKLRAAPKGTGIIAGGPVRAVCEVLGIKDIVAKSLGTANPHNVIRACMKALLKQNSPKNISALRNKKISEIIEKRG